MDRRMKKKLYGFIMVSSCLSFYLNAEDSKTLYDPTSPVDGTQVRLEEIDYDKYPSREAELNTLLSSENFNNKAEKIENSSNGLLVIKTIFVSDEKTFVRINEDIYKKGDTLGERKILDIKKTGILMQDIKTKKRQWIPIKKIEIK
jgi:hypothetical protein